MSYYLGLDSSTQGLKAEVIDTAAGKVVGSFAVNFKNDLPEYKSPSGYLRAGISRTTTNSSARPIRGCGSLPSTCSSIA